MDTSVDSESRPSVVRGNRKTVVLLMTTTSLRCPPDSVRTDSMNRLGYFILMWRRNVLTRTSANPAP